MSAPTSEFSELSIAGDMPPTQDQARRLQHAVGTHGQVDDGENNSIELTESPSGEEEGEEEEEPRPSAVLASSGITYSICGLDAQSMARALVGLTGRFEVVGCCVTPTGYDFRLSEQPQVNIASDAYTCTCAAFKSLPNVACQHIFWLLDQLHGCFLSQRPAANVPLSSNGHSPGLPPVEHLLEGKLEEVADRLNWQYVDSETRSGHCMTRPEKVRDVMSAFSAGTLPEDFRPDLVEMAEQFRTPEQCVVQGDFEATMFRLAVHDDDVFASLCKTMPAGACAAIYFDKIQEKSRKLLADFDRYCHTGQLPADSTTNVVEVSSVVEQIRRNTQRIHANILSRSPYGTEGATTALITLLEDISNRNKDALDGNMWGRVTFHGEDEDKRNLYHQLIGKTEDTDEEFFVLDALEYLPASDLRQFAAKLRGILHKIEVNRAPKLYIRKLGALVRVAESVASSSYSSLAQKRPAGGSSGGNTSKRTR